MHEAEDKSKNGAILRFVVCGWLLTLSVQADGQQINKIPKIGVLASASASSSTSNINAFRQGLRELGYTEGKNILIEYRHADGKLNRLSEFASELVRLKVDSSLQGEPSRLPPPIRQPVRYRLLLAPPAILSEAGLSQAFHGQVGILQARPLSRRT